MTGTARTAVLRFDASPAVGGGHAVRCLALADALVRAGWCCRLVVGSETVASVPAVADAGHRLVTLAGDGTAELDRLDGLGHVDLLVVDHYGRGEEFERKCRALARRVLVIDDLADRQHDCDILLDQTPERAAQDYQGLVPERCRLLLGPAYSLLRPEFARARPAALRRRPETVSVERVLIAAGASDLPDLTTLALGAAALALPGAGIDAVLGSTAPQLAGVRALASGLEQDVRVHVDARDMAQLIASADIGVGAAGSSALERCVLGLPSLLVVTADNQMAVAAGLEGRGAAVNLGVLERLDVSTLSRALAELACAPERRRAMGEAAAGLTDGRGAERAALACLPPRMGRHGRPVMLRPATLDDAAVLLRWQQDPRTRRFSRDPKPPSPDEHRAWLERSLAAPERCLFMLEYDGGPAGVLRLDEQDDGAEEVSIYVDPAHHRRGLAAAGLAHARALRPAGRLVAEVKPENIASRRLFEAAGYVRRGTWFVSESESRRAGAAPHPAAAVLREDMG